MLQIIRLCQISKYFYHKVSKILKNGFGEDMVEVATFARVIDLKPPVNIPSTFIQLIGDQEKKNAVIIYSPKNDLIRIILTNASEICKVEAKINGLDREFLSSLSGFLGAYRITLIYSTGFCEKSPCTYEGYFEKDTLKMSLEKFKTHFSNLKGVSDVKIMQFQV